MKLFSVFGKQLFGANYEGLKRQAEKLFGFEVVNNYDWIKDINVLDFLRDYDKVVENFEDAILRPKVVGLKTGKIYNLARDLSCANVIVL